MSTKCMYTREECLRDPDKNAVRVKKLLAEKSLPERGMIWAIENLFYISSTESGEILLTLMPAQKHFLENISRSKFKKNIVPKARRIGISTASKAFMMYYATFFPDMRCVLVGVDREKMEVHHRDFHYMYERLPDFLKPPKKYSTKQGIIYKHGSYISITSNIRGEGANIIMVTEADFIQNFKEKWKASFPGIPIHGAIIKESTANGAGSIMHEEVLKAQEEPDKYNMQFYGWNWDPRNRSKPPKGFTKTKEEELLAKEYDLDDAQLYWRRLMIAELGEEGFKEEYPINVGEAYRTRGAGVFIPSVIDRLRLNRVKPVIDLQDKRVFLKPKQGRKYVAATDTSEGIGGDYCVTHIFDCTDPNHFEQVAILRDNQTHLYDFMYESLDLVKKYNRAFWGIEINYDKEVVAKIKAKGYSNMYRRTDPTSTRRDDAPRRTYGWLTNSNNKSTLVNEFKQGFNTGYITIHDEWTLNEMQMFMRNPDGPKASVYYGAPNGQHDDTVMAAMIAYEMRKHIKITKLSMSGGGTQLTPAQRMARM